MARGELARRPAAPALTGRAIPAGTAVARRDTVTHGDWVRNVGQVVQALEVIGLHQQAMLSGLTSANASRSQITDVGKWSADAGSARQYIRDWLARIDSQLAPLIDAVDAAGGVDEVADSGYFTDI
jgi:hypothetical protein